jgi:hypothetical protein
MVSQKVVTPVPGFRRDRVTGVQVFCKSMNKLDSGACPGPRSGIRRNDGKWAFGAFYERINDDEFVKSPVHPSIPQGERFEVILSA